MDPQPEPPGVLPAPTMEDSPASTSSSLSHKHSGDEADQPPSSPVREKSSSGQHNPPIQVTGTVTPARNTRANRKANLTEEPLRSLYQYSGAFDSEDIVDPRDSARHEKEKWDQAEKERKQRLKEAQKAAERHGLAENVTETDLLARIREMLSRGQVHLDDEKRSGEEIMSTENDCKSTGLTSDRKERLDDSIRSHMRSAENEKKAADEAIDLIAVLQAMLPEREPVSRNGTTGKGRKPQRAPVEPEAVADSPGPSPNESRVEVLKRTKGTGQRSSSVASSGRSGAAALKAEEASESSRGIAAERGGQLVVGAEVVYKTVGGATEDSGVGSVGHIKKVWSERVPITYDVQDPDDEAGHKNVVHTAKAKDLIPIPRAGAQLTTFPNGGNVVARYPETDTFYKAEVRGFAKGKYTLMFEGEENDLTMEVDKRFVLDSKLF